MASYASKQSTAIDYQRFAPAPREEQAEPQLEVLPPDRRSRKGKAINKAKAPYGKYVLIGACVFAVLAVIIFSYMTVNELTVENHQMRSDITTLKSRENALVAKKEQIYNLAYVEEFAKTNLGMVKLDKSEVRYVELQNPERMTAAQDEAGAAGKAVGTLIRSFSAVLEYLN